MKRFLCLPLVVSIFLAGALSSPAGAQSVPNPHDTLFITADIPFEGVYGSGRAYIYLADSTSTLTNPVIAVEGFDLDNSWDWDELYNHLNHENLLETIRGEGYDIVMLDFTDATDYIQRNSFVVVELIRQVQAMIDPEADFVISGASMGGLCSRYALAYMETYGLEHRARTFISFDAPNRGANIPLGIQYWLDFFSGLSDAAADMLSSLNRPAARQMLVYHYTVPPGSTGEADSLRGELLSDFASIGEYPQNLRKVAIANGSGYQTGQGFAPGDQIIQYEYEDLATTIRGNVWAVPDNTEQMIFDGYIRYLFLPTSMQVNVSGTKPYDNAPGGWRSSMAAMDSTEAPYGDIIALYDNHSFIPTISSLEIETEDLFYDIAGDPGIMSRTPFDTIYYPSENQDHASITSQNALWFLNEIGTDVTGTNSKKNRLPPYAKLYQNYPNPFNPVTTIRFDLKRPEIVNLSVFNVRGELITNIVDKHMEEGRKELTWRGIDRHGTPVASGVYFCRLRAGGLTLTRKMILLR